MHTHTSLKCFSLLRFGGGPAVNHLYMCAICQVEIEALAKRRKIEIDTFIKVFCRGTPVCLICLYALRRMSVFLSCLQLNKEFQAEEAPTVILCISMQWFREWESFVKGKDNGMNTWGDKYSRALKVLSLKNPLFLQSRLVPSTTVKLVL